MSRALEKAKEGLSAARKGAANVRKKTKRTEDAGLAVLIGYGGAKYYGKWVAKRVRDKKPLTIKQIGMSYGRTVGGALAIGGALGLLGDDRTNTIGLIAGTAVLGADAGIEGYLEEVAAAPAGGAPGGGAPPAGG